jgi:hypothetical protein
MWAKKAATPEDEAALKMRPRSAVGEVVRMQKEMGIDIPNDGEFGKPMRAAINCGLGGRVPPQTAWATLRALRDGTAIASKKLWELNSKMPVRDEQKKKQESLEVKVCPLIFLPELSQIIRTPRAA